MSLRPSALSLTSTLWTGFLCRCPTVAERGGSGALFLRHDVISPVFDLGLAPATVVAPLLGYRGCPVSVPAPSPSVGDTAHVMVSMAPLYSPEGVLMFSRCPFPACRLLTACSGPCLPSLFSSSPSPLGRRVSVAILLLILNSSSVVDRTPLLHRLVYHPCLQGQLRGVGFGAW